jgi:hypothetical protein
MLVEGRVVLMVLVLVVSAVAEIRMFKEQMAWVEEEVLELEVDTEL